MKDNRTFHDALVSFGERRVIKMILTAKERDRLRLLLGRYVEDVHVQEMKQFKQHGAVSTFEHCMNVVRVSYWLNQRLGLHADESVLVIGALLHDFYLYDWHVPENTHRFHGFSHAREASRNAVRYFKINKRTQAVIVSHMWPLNITCIPRSREAVIVCAADKICSAIETVWQRKRCFRICG